MMAMMMSSICSIVVVILSLATTAARRVHMAGDNSEGDPRLVPLGLHADPDSVRLACSAIRWKARVRADDVDVITEHRVGAYRRQNAPVPAAVAAVHCRHRLGTSAYHIEASSCYNATKVRLYIELRKKSAKG